MTSQTPSNVSEDNYGIASLWAAPDVLLEVIEKLNQEVTDYSSVLESINKDPALYLRVLSVSASNAPLNNASLPRLSNSLAAVGADHLNDLATQCAVDYFFTERSQTLETALRHYWQRAYNCARIARHMAIQSRYAYPEEAYLAGLLHNIGQLVYLMNYGDEYADTCNSASSSIALELFEREWLNTTSSATASELLEGLISDSFLADALHYQHEAPSAIADMPLLVRILNIAVKLCDPGLDDQTLDKDAEQLLGLNRSQYLDLQQRLSRPDPAKPRSLALVTATTEATEATLYDAVKSNLGHHIKTRATLHSLRYTPPAEQLYNRALVWRHNLTKLLEFFDLSSALAFQFNAQANSLKGVCGLTRNTDKQLSTARIEQLSYGLNSPPSSVTQALHSGSTQVFLSAASPQHASLIDRHLCRVLGCPGIISIPLIYDGTPQGVIVAAAGKTQIERTLADSTDLVLFAKAAGQNLAQRPAADHQQLMLSVLQHSLRTLAQQADNPLTTIRNHLEVLQLETGGQNSAVTHFSAIRQQLDQLQQICLQLQQPECLVAAEYIDLNQYLRDQAALLNPPLPAANPVRIDLNLSATPLPMAVSARLLNDTVPPVLERAVHVTPANGMVVISTQQGINLGGQLFYRATIKDNGPQLDKKSLQALLSPATDNKSSGVSGLTLANVSTLLEQAGGSVSVENSSEEGVLFTLLFPVQTDQPVCTSKV